VDSEKQMFHKYEKAITRSLNSSHALFRVFASVLLSIPTLSFHLSGFELKENSGGEIFAPSVTEQKVVLVEHPVNNKC